MTYDESLFAGAAKYYARYRVPYPPELIADIVAHFELDGAGRLLDLGCGPGTLTLPLARYFESVLAVDVSAEMIAQGQQLSTAGNVSWRVMPAEAISTDLGRFRLVTCGSSFHWMDRDHVLARVREVLEPGCGIALVGGVSAWLDGPEDWHKVVTKTVRRYLGKRRGIPAPERFEQTLPRNGWRVELARDYDRELEWDVDGVIGHLWSTSFAHRSLFGDSADEFEAELRRKLLARYPDGRFRETGIFGLVCGRPG
jgi:trans-aconitate methyltransferase